MQANSTATPVNMTTDFREHSQQIFETNFFYSPPNDFQTYHITCSEMPVTFELVYQLLNNTDCGNNQANNYARSNNYVFYHEQLNTKKVYRVTCELASPQYLNKRFYDIECNQSDKQHFLKHWGDLKCHLKQFLISYLTPTNYNTMQDNYNDQAMCGSDQLPTFQDVDGNYIRDHGDNSDILPQQH